MSKGAFNFFEMHAEKFALGLAGTGLLGMLWSYMVGSPNKLEYGGQEYGPRDLLQAVYDDSQRLDRAIKGATAEDPKIDNYSDKLKSEVTAGIFAGGDAPGLRMVTTLGKAIEVPGLEEAEEVAGSVALVTPLKPTTPAALTGRSLVVKKPIELSLSGQSAPPPTAAASDEGEELAWVSVAAYFDKKAQYQEMVSAKYAPYRTKVYVAGLDVERQEKLATGEWSDWKPAPASGAAPKLELRDPIFDSQTGELVNREEIDQMFRLVKAEQPLLLQPPFYEVKDGSSWEVPPIEGFEREYIEEDVEDAPAPKAPQAPPPTSERPIGSGRGEGGRSGGFGLGGPADNTAELKREAQKMIREELKEGKLAAQKQDWNKLRDIAQKVATNEYANAADKKKVESWRRKAEAELAKAGRASAGAPRPPRTGEMSSVDPRGASVGMAGASARPAEAIQLVTHPEKGLPAVWYHDDGVEAGKTYRYRMRVKLWNRYVGRIRALQQPEQAKQVVILGDWSEPSDPITVTPPTHFFVKGGRDTANVDVWKWRAGRWIRQAFEVGVGDVIGEVRKTKTGDLDADGNEERVDIDFTTGAVVLDVRPDESVPLRQAGKDGAFRYSDKKSLTVIYLDPADGQVKERTQLFDKSDRTRKQLEDDEI